MENEKFNAEVEGMRQCEEIFQRLQKFQNVGSNHAAVHGLGFDRQGIYVFTIFGTLLDEEKLESLIHLLEVGTFFKEKLVKYRVIYFVDTDKSSKNLERGSEAMEAMFKFSEIKQSN